MQALPAGGKMVAVRADEDMVNAELYGMDAPLSIAAVNGPRHIVISGDGNANVHALDLLTGTITGSGNINYLGSPEVNVSITGSGKVNNVN